MLKIILRKQIKVTELKLCFVIAKVRVYPKHPINSSNEEKKQSQNAHAGSDVHLTLI